MPPLKVKLERIPYSEFFTVTLPDGSSDELSPEKTIAWFQERGANIKALEPALDYVWNFYHSEVVINNPVETKKKGNPTLPDV